MFVIIFLSSVKADGNNFFCVVLFCQLTVANQQLLPSPE